MNSGCFKKGEKRFKQGKRGKGKLTKELKDMILGALDKAGGEEYLIEQSRTNPNAFLTLVGKVLPLQVTGKDGGALFDLAGLLDGLDRKKRENGGGVEK